MSAVAPDLRGKIYRERRLMQPAETTEFLRRQKVANVGTVDASGRPYVVPLVYIYEGGDLLYLHGLALVGPAGIARDHKNA